MINPQTIKQLLSILPKNQKIESTISGLFFYCADRPSQALSYIQEPSICIVLQGEREIYLGTECQRFDNSHLMFCPVNIPLSMHIREATIDNPVIVLSMRLNLVMIREVLAKIPAQQMTNGDYLGIKWRLDDTILSAFERLIHLLNYPDVSYQSDNYSNASYQSRSHLKDSYLHDIEFLAPLIQQEIYYRLLRAPQGTKLRQLVTHDSHVEHIAQATDWLKAHFDQHIIIEDLASNVGMSVSGFHQHFKDITGLSPLQYQKNLRLMEARRLVQLGEEQITQIAMNVGYESPSQFSREYKRLFGISPSQELSRLLI